MLTRHRYWHRSNGKSLCKHDCAVRDLCAWLAVMLKVVAASKSAPHWMLIRECVGAYLGVELPDQVDLRRVIMRDLARLPVFYAPPAPPDDAFQRRCAVRYPATCSLLADLIFHNSEHSATVSEPHETPSLPQGSEVLLCLLLVRR